MILVSGCLVGINCKYSGGNNYDERIFNLVKEGKAIPVCPEQLGGLPTPRFASEINDEKVINKNNEDVTVQYKRGAEETLNFAKKLGIKQVILQPRSPSCGKGKIYSGKFDGTLINGNGITAELLMKNGIEVLMPDEYFN